MTMRISPCNHLTMACQEEYEKRRNRPLCTNKMTYRAASVAVFLAVVCQSFFAEHCAAWVSSGIHSRSAVPSPPITRLAAADDKNDNEANDDIKEEEEEFRRRMAVVRSLQMSYYKPAVAVPDKNGSEEAVVQPRCSLDEATGELLSLPLFRAPWWEVPGRSNVLNIHEPIYTNMFETILYGPKPWTFGHLYLQDGSRNLKSEDPQLQLETWESTPKNSGSAVLGCLMNISDFRRLADGRLLLLVHAMERFVITDVKQRLPYGIANAQILPDAEEIDPGVDFGLELKEKDLSLPRALAIQESVRYHDYEYDRDHVLPVDDRADLGVTDITGSDIAKVLPYCPFSKTLDPPAPSYEPVLPFNASSKDNTNNDEPLPSLEYRLLCRGVYQTPLSDPDFPQRQSLSTDELEYELWLAINNFLILTRTPVSPVLLGLLPIHLDIWPTSIPTIPTMSKDSSSSLASNNSSTAVFTDQATTTTTTTVPAKPFALKQIVSGLASLDSVEHDFVQVAPEYPPHRRQRRLSYSAAHLLESDFRVANDLRPKLLAAPTTHQRLRMVLETFDQWQEAKLGEFQ